MAEHGDRMARRMRDHHVHGSIVLPPGITDVRPWQWHGFIASIVYTYIVPLPLDPALVSRSARRRASKAAGLGFTCEITDDADAIGVCLADTERRQGFSYGMSTDQLRIALQRIGTSAVRMYLCRDSDGNAAASRVVLHSARGTAVDWLAGTSDPQLSSGATQLLIKFALEDLGSVGATHSTSPARTSRALRRRNLIGAAISFRLMRSRNLDHGASRAPAARGGGSRATGLFRENIGVTARSGTNAEAMRRGGGPATSANVADLLWSAAAGAPNTPAIEDGSTITDYQTLAARAGGIAEELQRDGLAEGERVAILLHRGVEAAAALLWRRRGRWDRRQCE